MARVLRIPVEKHRADFPFVLCHITAAGSLSSGPSLDLSLVATEGSSPYKVSLKHKDISSLKPKNIPCSNTEWEAILAYLLLGRVEEKDEDVIKGAEMIASVEEGVAIEITVRKRIEDITQRLATIRLPCEEDEEIQLFEWCGLALETANDSLRQVDVLKASQAEQQSTITQLKDQLTALTKAKEEHESVFFKKFQQLVNSKKAKIRDQQRLLAAASVDPEKLKQVQGARAKTVGSKRKSQQDEEDSDDSDAFAEPMEVDQKAADGGTESEEERRSDEATTEEEDYEEDMEDDHVPPPASTQTSTKNGGEIEAGMDETPPPRELPFNRKGPAAATRSSQATVDSTAKTQSGQGARDDDDETESDEEL